MPRLRTPCLLLSLALAACATSPEDAQMADALCAQGKTLLIAGKNSDARDIYASATYRDDDNARAWNGLGVAYDLLGKRNDAQASYQRALDLATADLSVTNNLAHLDLEMGKPDDAVALLQPHANDPAAPAALKQNLATALKAVQAKQDSLSDVYADLGSYPTEGMAQGHLREARGILDDKSLTFAVIPEVKTGGGIPTFTVKATGHSPQDICDALNPQAIPCIVHGE